MNRNSNTEVGGSHDVESLTSAKYLLNLAGHELQRSAVFFLAVAATITSLAIAAFSGWQRGSSLPEQLTCSAWAVLAVMCTHLLPALCRKASSAVRLAVGLMWIVSLVVVLCGQMSVFLLAQQHAGDHRADAVPEVATLPAVAASSGRSLTAIAQDQARTKTELAIIDSGRCASSCSAMRLHRVALADKLDALATEADEAKRHEAAIDRHIALSDRAIRLHDALRSDPVVGRLAGWLGVDVERLNLLQALVCAVVLDGMASLCWYIAFAPRHTSTTAETTPVVVSGGEGRRESVVPDDTSVTDPVVRSGASRDLDHRLIQIVRDVGAGKLHPTVEGIRAHFNCAQATAIELRREYEAFRLSLQS